jgi:AmmeMemoRadiSam system protein B
LYVKSIAVIIGFLFFGLFAFYFFDNSQATKAFDPNDSEPRQFHLGYPMELEFYEDAFAFAKDEQPAGNVVAGIIPHHLLAADLIARFFTGIEGADYDTVILIGPNHFSAGNADIISSEYGWQTPYGVLECDRELLGAIESSFPVSVEEDAIRREHAITGEVAFIKKTFPGAKFVPFIVKPGVTAEEAERMVWVIFELIKRKKALVLASVDFSHYKDSHTAQADDKNSIGAIECGDSAAVYRAALDSPATITAVMAYSRLAGANFKLKDNSNSAILSDKPDLESTTSYVTGYFVK